jgi:protein tyrosine/serine phosphatase
LATHYPLSIVNYPLKECLAVSFFLLLSDRFLFAGRCRYLHTLFSAREDFLNAAIEEMERRYGDTDTYLQRGIGLTKEERKRLQDILLTDN